MVKVKKKSAKNSKPYNMTEKDVLTEKSMTSV